MARQLERLIEATGIYQVTIQVIPYSAGAHAAMDSTFTIMEFADRVPNVVYVEGLVGWIYIERPQDVARYEQVFDHLCDSDRYTGQLLIAEKAWTTIWKVTGPKKDLTIETKYT